MILALLLSQGTCPGSSLADSIQRDDPSVYAWAVSCDLQRGPGILTFPDSVEVSFGEAGLANGKADGLVVSLGDRGMATLSFDQAIVDGPGPDLAVFENSFDGRFLELAFVEVSSDGNRFVRFPSFSATQTLEQVESFGILDPDQIRNLAGKFISGWGTCFDLEELKDSSALDINNIIAVRIIDVVGILNDSLGSRDAEGRIINDPFPTPWENGGFDLDAVAVLKQLTANAVASGLQNTRIWPNPFNEYLHIESPDALGWRILDTDGRQLARGNNPGGQIPTGSLKPGIYLLEISNREDFRTLRIIKTSDLPGR